MRDFFSWIQDRWIWWPLCYKYRKMPLLVQPLQ